VIGGASFKGLQMFEAAACKAADWFASPYAIAALPIICAAWLYAGFDMNALTLALSVLAITIMRAELDELVRAVPEADETVVYDAAA
jgi:hypothetical protein